jgi:hypothetical protein
MARARNLKPGFFTNDELAETGPLGMLLFEALWCLADREGRMEDRPKKLKIEALPYFDADVDALLTALAARGFVLRYEVDGVRYLQIVNFLKHQNPHVKEAPSTIPAPPSTDGSDCQALDQHQTSTGLTPDEHEKSPADSLNPHPDSGFRIPDCGSAAQAPPPAPKPSPDAPLPGKRTRGERATKAPAAFELTDEHYEYATVKGLTTPQTIEETERFLNWCRSKGQTYVDWQAAWKNWITRAVGYRAEQTPFRGRAPAELFNGQPVFDHRGNPTPAFFLRQAEEWEREDAAQTAERGTA